MAKRQIRPAASNKERQETYKYQLEKYSKAMEMQFYFEAMMIAYTMLEDRMKSLLYYLGVFDIRDTLDISRKVKEDLQTITKDKEYDLSSITGKMALIQDIFNWYKQSNFFESQYDSYQINLKKLLDGLDIGSIEEAFGELQKWLKYRNEIMHAAMNKNVDALYEGLEEKVSMGMKYARIIDAQVKCAKRNNYVRKQLKMGNN